MTDETVADEVEIDPLAEKTVVAPPPPDDKTPSQPPEESSPSVDTKPAVDPVQARINKITAEKYGEKRRADAAELRLAELEGNQTPVAPTEAPKLEDFDFDEAKFNAATIEYQVDQRFAAQATQGQQQAADDARQNAAANFATKEAEFGATTPDYSEVVKNIPQLHPDTLDVIYSMENGPQLAHYLGSHLDVADKIANASPVNAAVELGRIAATLATSTKTVETTSAPEPVDTLAGAAGGVGKPLDDMSMDEVMHLP